MEEGRALPAIDEDTRRRLGITYTPTWIVDEMVRWAKEHGTPHRIVDAGAGTGRFTFAVARAFPKAQIIAVELERKSARVLKRSAAASPHAARITVHQGDYLRFDLPPIEGKTLFIGNPPYVRHHLIGARKKAAYVRLTEQLGLPTNTKAGLHLHFFLHTRRLARAGDYGIFIAAAEWIHADYGSGFRSLLLNGMGGLSVDTFAAERDVFPDVMTTAAVVCFEVGNSRSTIAFSEVQEHGAFTVGAGRRHGVEALGQAKHWSAYARGGVPIVAKSGETRVGDLFRVRRGQVTGAKDVWIHGADAPRLPERLLFPAITAAREIVDAEGRIATAEGLRLVVDLPHDLSQLSKKDRDAAKRFREWARRRGAALPYIARYRSRWWSVELFEPAPIICTYMGRRPPVFALNTAGVRHLNIAHGLYPRSHMTWGQLAEMVEWLNANATRAHGRTYARALIKCEPSDIADIPLPAHLVAGIAMRPPEAQVTSSGRRGMRRKKPVDNSVRR